MDLDWLFKIAAVCAIVAPIAFVLIAAYISARARKADSELRARLSLDSVQVYEFDDQAEYPNILVQMNLCVWVDLKNATSYVTEDANLIRGAAAGRIYTARELTEGNPDFIVENRRGFKPSGRIIKSSDWELLIPQIL